MRREVIDAFIETLEAAQAGDRRALKSLTFVTRYGHRRDPVTGEFRPATASEIVAAEQRALTMGVTRQADGSLRVATRQPS